MSLRWIALKVIEGIRLYFFYVCVVGKSNDYTISIKYLQMAHNKINCMYKTKPFRTLYSSISGKNEKKKCCKDWANLIECLCQKQFFSFFCISLE